MSNTPGFPRASSLVGLTVAASALAVLASGPALANGFGAGSSLPLIDTFVDKVVDWIGFRELTGDRRDLFALCLIIYAAVFGYLTDLALRDRGFGKALNGVVGAAGICLALALLTPHVFALADVSDRVRANLTLIIIGAGSAVTLIVTSALKGVLMSALRLNLDRMDLPPPPAPIAEPASTDPRIASALREKI
ncbi:hypothetical protein [Rhodoblastus sp.]|uniref:hypothetical protein n=1 Tax=Rhodoblastus sp. TaxID=1962975 RepID=UPI0035B0E2DE